MRRISPALLNVGALVASCLLLLVDLLLMTPPATSAQSNCPPIPMIAFPYWEPNHDVTVVFQTDSNWTDNEIAVMKKAFDNWTAVRGFSGNNSGETSYRSPIIER